MDDLQAFVRDDYGRQLASSADLKTNACCASGAPPRWTAARFARWFDVTGSRGTHFGLYPCGPTLAAAQYQGAASGGDCATGACC